MQKNETLQPISYENELAQIDRRVLYFINLIEGPFSPRALAEKEAEILHDCAPFLPAEYFEALKTHFLEVRQPIDVKVRLASVTDSLTRLPDRGFFWKYFLPGLVEMGSEKCFGFFADSCNLKDLNTDEFWGHRGGDAAVAALALILREITLRFGCLLVRYGGDEFLLLSEKPFSDPKQVLQAIERGSQKITAEALIQGTIGKIPILNYATSPPSQIRLAPSGYERLGAIANGELAQILFPLNVVGAPFSFDPRMTNEEIEAVLGEADKGCEGEKRQLMRQWAVKYPEGVVHLARR